MSDVQNTPVNRNCLACAFPFWDQLTPEEQAQLCRFTRPVRYRKGERVHSPVENCVGILLLRSGQLRAYRKTEVAVIKTLATEKRSMSVHFSR